MIRIIGNAKPKATLAAFLKSGRVPHALLIQGEKGSGKFTFARMIAQSILCSEDSQPCGQCRHCKKVESGSHPDLLVYQGEGGTRSFHLETVQQARQQAYVMPNEASRKIIILKNAQDMTVQAQNALLKIVEEPPPGVIFLITCENKDALLETILSRVQILSIELPSVQQCSEWLQHLLPQAAPEQCEEAAQHAGGNVGKAIQLLEQQEGWESRQQAGDILLHLVQGRELEALAALALWERKRVELGQILLTMKELVGECLHPRHQLPPIPAIINATTVLQRLQIIAIIDEASTALAQNQSGLLLSTVLCSKIRLALEEA